ncbi:hypothetical protein ACHAXT_009403 [Thalassiosira profunda]
MLGIIANGNIDNYFRHAKASADGRTAYGYRRPRPPFEAVRHISHTCKIPSSSGQYSRKVHLQFGVPNLILIGAQKAGTSTFLSIFDRHPQMVKPARKSFEPHFFDWNVPGVTTKHFNRTESQLCKLRESYSQLFDMAQIQPNVSVAFEKTPAYILFPGIPSAIDSVCPWKPKILASLRNPIDRAWSQYQMQHGNKNSSEASKEFTSLVDREIKHFLQSGLVESAMTIEEFERSDYRVPPFRFPANRTLQEYAQKMQKYRGDRKGLLYRGLYAPLLLPWVEQFASEDRLMLVQFEAFMSLENEGNNTILSDVLGFAGVAENSGGGGRRKLASLVAEARRRRLVWAHKNKAYDSLPDGVRQYLLHLFRPFNDFLADLLGDEWRGVWD